MNAITCTINAKSDRKCKITKGPFGGHLEYFMEQKPVIRDEKFQQSMKSLKPGFLRFPGGEDSDNYHWKTRTIAHSDWFYGHADPEIDLDTDTFLDWCKENNAEAVICLNYDTGAFVNDYEGVYAEALEWLEYTNITNRWNVKYWEFGNEVFFSVIGDKIVPIVAEEYGERYLELRRRMKKIDPGILLGLPLTHFWNQDETWVESRWNERVMDVVKGEADYIILHPYYMEGYEQFIKHGYDMSLILTTIREKILSLYQYEPEIVITEWGMEHRLKDICVDSIGSALGVIEGVLGIIDGGVSRACYWPLRWTVWKDGVWAGHELGPISQKDNTLTASGQALAWLCNEVAGLDLLTVRRIISGESEYRVYSMVNNEGTILKTVIINRDPKNTIQFSMNLDDFNFQKCSSVVFKSSDISVDSYLEKGEAEISSIAHTYLDSNIIVNLPPVSATLITVEK